MVKGAIFFRYVRHLDIFPRLSSRKRRELIIATATSLPNHWPKLINAAATSLPNPTGQATTVNHKAGKGKYTTFYMALPAAAACM